jgi:hypothetical protein
MTEIAIIRVQLKQQENLGVFRNREGLPFLEIKVCQTHIGLTKTSTPMHVQKFILTDEEAIFLVDTIKQLL